MKVSLNASSARRVPHSITKAVRRSSCEHCACTLNYRGAQLFHKSIRHLKIIGAGGLHKESSIMRTHKYSAHVYKTLAPRISAFLLNCTSD